MRIALDYTAPCQLSRRTHVFDDLLEQFAAERLPSVSKTDASTHLGRGHVHGRGAQIPAFCVMVTTTLRSSLIGTFAFLSGPGLHLLESSESTWTEEEPLAELLHREIVSSSHITIMAMYWVYVRPRSWSMGV